MNPTPILALLQLAVSLLISAQTNPGATIAQKNLALSFASQAVSISSGYVSQINNPGATTAPTLPATATTPAASPAPAANAPAETTPPAKSLFATPLGATVNRVKTNVDDVAILNLSASPSGGIALATLKITFSGSLVSSSFGNADVKLLNSSNVAIGTLAPVACNTGPSCVFSWSNFGSSGIISAGGSLPLKLRIDSLANTAAASAGISEILSAVIQSTGDLTYNTAIDNSGATVGLPLTAVPLVLNSVSYSPGT